jgi:hypothetical protein
MPPSATLPKPSRSTNPTSAASPILTEAILEGKQPAALELDDLLKQFTVEWDKQLETLTES